MKQVMMLFFCSCISVAIVKNAKAQDNRLKIQLTINYQQKALETALNSVSTSLTRPNDEGEQQSNPKDTSKTEKTFSYGNGFYINIDAKSLSNDMLQLFSKKATRFSGTITIIDTYGKNPDRTIKFSQAWLTNLSDQYSASYGDSYGTTAFAIMCKEVSVNGIPLEQ